MFGSVILLFCSVTGKERLYDELGKIECTVWRREELKRNIQIKSHMQGEKTVVRDYNVIKNMYYYNWQIKAAKSPIPNPQNASMQCFPHFSSQPN